MYISWPLRITVADRTVIFPFLHFLLGKEDTRILWELFLRQKYLEKQN